MCGIYSQALAQCSLVAAAGSSSEIRLLYLPVRPEREQRYRCSTQSDEPGWDCMRHWVFSVFSVQWAWSTLISAGSTLEWQQHMKSLSERAEALRGICGAVGGRAGLLNLLGSRFFAFALGCLSDVTRDELTTSMVLHSEHRVWINWRTPRSTTKAQGKSTHLSQPAVVSFASAKICFSCLLSCLSSSLRACSLQLRLLAMAMSRK
jgi:hypothetical protein